MQTSTPYGLTIAGYVLSWLDLYESDEDDDA
jgi:hypothetical protein